MFGLIPDIKFEMHYARKRKEFITEWMCLNLSNTRILQANGIARFNSTNLKLESSKNIHLKFRDIATFNKHYQKVV